MGVSLGPTVTVIEYGAGATGAPGPAIMSIPNGPTGIAGHTFVLKDMPTPDDLISQPQLKDWEISDINSIMLDIANKLSTACGNDLVINPLNIGVKYREMIKSKLEQSNWEVKTIFKWLNWNDFGKHGLCCFIRNKYWCIRPSIDYLMNRQLKDKYKHLTFQQNKDTEKGTHVLCDLNTGSTVG